MFLSFLIKSEAKIDIHMKCHPNARIFFDFLFMRPFF